MVSEGLANMCTVFTPLAAPEPPLWVLASSSPSSESRGVIGTARAYLQEAVAANIYPEIVAQSKEPEYMARSIGNFQRKVVTFCDPSVGKFAEGLNMHFPMKFSDDCLASSGSDGAGAVEAVPLLREIREAQALIAAAYLASDGEFFVIHGVTSLHAVLTLMPHLTLAQQRDLLVHWLRAVLAVYVAVNFPGLPKLLELLDAWELREASASPSCTVGNSSDSALRSDDTLLWSTRLSVSQLSTDEHVSKAVYVMWRWCQWEHVPPHSRDLFCQAADHQIRPVGDTGEVGAPHNHLWFSN